MLPTWEMICCSSLLMSKLVVAEVRVLDWAVPEAVWSFSPW